MVYQVSESVKQTYIRDYNALDCHNLSLDEYIKKRHDQEIDELREIGRIECLKESFETMNAVNIPFNPPENYLPRTIIVDGANVMHGGSTYNDERNNKSGAKIPDVAALLSIVRYFVIRNFEVIVVISRKYALKDATNFPSAIEALVKNHICIIAPKTNLDDTICLDLAAEINGVVVTSDKYRDHAYESERYRRLVENNRLHIEWIHTTSQPNTRTKRDGDYVAGKRFYFSHDSENLETNQEEVFKRIYVGNFDAPYQLTRERIALCQPEKKKQKILALLSSLIVEGLTICKETAQEIITKPLPGPNQKPAESGFPQLIRSEVPDDHFEDPHHNQIASYDDDPLDEW